MTDVRQPATGAQSGATTSGDAIHTDDLLGRDATAAGDATTGDADTSTPLLANSDELLAQWTTVQSGFVDDPRQAVEQADSLVATVIQQLAEQFANERAALEQQWTGGQDVSTEDLRVALQRYRSFFNRLLER